MSCHYLFLRLRSVAAGNQTPNPACGANALTHCATAAVKYIRSDIFTICIITHIKSEYICLCNWVSRFVRVSILGPSNTMVRCDMCTVTDCSKWEVSGRSFGIREVGVQISAATGQAEVNPLIRKAIKFGVLLIPLSLQPTYSGSYA